MKITLKVWRQPGPDAPGKFETYEHDGIIEDMSFLEMLDVFNEKLLEEGIEPIAFEHDCREGICGSCGCMVNGRAQGPGDGATLCQVHMRHYKDGDTITLEPFRAKAFPVLRDLIVDRSAFDDIIQAGGYVSVRTGAGQDANALPIEKAIADEAFDAATCIGCGACVASCPNGSASLFTSAKLAHLNILPQGEPEKYDRTSAMVAAMDEAGFGACSNLGECEATCPKGISLEYISLMNRNLIWSELFERE